LSAQGGIGALDPDHTARPHERQVLPMKVRILVSLKPGVLDPQGRAVHHALEGMGFEGVDDVRIGRTVELDVADSTSDEALEKMCEQLLANTVIENYRIERLG
jgi:phosphoribosylformylglycinamidine synthase